MPSFRLLFLALALGNVAAGCATSGTPTAGVDGRGPTPGDAARASYAVIECDVPLPAGQDPANVVCGELTVPENWDTDSGRKVRLRTVVLRSTAAEPEPDPFVYLSGGPGSPALVAKTSGLQVFDAEFAAPIQSKRDLVFLDLRGTGRSDPLLSCPETEDAMIRSFAEVISEDEERTRTVESAGACAERLRGGGLDFAGFTSAQMARDVDVLREVLGYAEWNIWGVSYGTRLLQTILRDRPEHVRSVVFDSAVPLQNAYVTDLGSAFVRAIRALSAACDASTACASTTPDLAAAFDAAVEALNRSPAELHPVDSATGEPATVFLTGSRFAFLVQQAMYLTDQLPLIPGIISRASTPEVIPFLESVLDVRAISAHAEALFASVVCQEEFPFVPPSERPDPLGLGPTFEGFETLYGYPFTEALCASVRIPPGPSIEGEAVYSDVPALALHGDLDPIAPPEYSRILVERFSRSHFVEFPGFGHGILRARSKEALPRCAMQLVTGFLDDPLGEPDMNCVDRLPATL